MLNSLVRIFRYGMCFLLLISLHIAPAYAEKMEITFINPSYPEDPFWSLMTNIMRLAAADLDIQLTVHYAKRNRFTSLSLAEEIVTSTNKPDYLVFHFQAQVGAKMLAAAEKAKVYSLVINTKVAESEKQEIGEPRGKFKYWLGHIVPNDFQAGQLLGQALINQWRARNNYREHEAIRMIGLTGTYDNSATIERESGLKSELMQQQDVILQQVVSADWSRQKAAQVTKVLLNRYPETNLVWCASDLMAIGAIEAIEEMGRKPGVDILIGGIDGVDIGLDAVEGGKMAATVSGHFIEAAWAMVLLFEHFHGRDPFKDRGTELHSSMHLVDADTVKTVQDRMNLDYLSKIDFNTFTGNQRDADSQPPLSLPEVILSSISGRNRSDSRNDAFMK